VQEAEAEVAAKGKSKSKINRRVVSFLEAKEFWLEKIDNPEDPTKYIPSIDVVLDTAALIDQYVTDGRR
jgi:hypothetical protein